MSLSIKALRVFQDEHRDWLKYNFPDQAPHDALLGLAEEVGELAHAHLKFEQGIRGLNEAEYRRQAGDAIGDIMIYLASYCNTNGFDMAWELEKAWEEVRARDWQTHPETGAATTSTELPPGEGISGPHRENPE